MPAVGVHQPGGLSSMDSGTHPRTNPPTPTVIHILRHGQSLHNITKPYPHRDPPLTDLGKSQAAAISPHLPPPSLIALSPMTRTIQTTLLAFDSALQGPNPPKVQIWPDLREAHGAICNMGVSRGELEAKFPQFDYSECREVWDYDEHTTKEAVERAERVRKRVKGLEGQGGGSVYLVSHRGFIAFLVGGKRFDVCEHRRYRFASGEELEREGCRYGENIDSGLMQDFGPTLLVPL